MNKKILLPAAVAVVITAAAAFGAIGVSAQNADMHDNLVQRISEKFGLNEAEVEAVFDEMREEHHEEMQTKFEERLNEAVQEGSITEEQKALIQAKHEEIEKEREANRENWQNLTSEERRTQMQAQREEMESWAEENGIDMSLFFNGRQGGMMRGHGFGK